MSESIIIFILLICAAVCWAAWFPSLGQNQPAGSFRLVDAPSFQSTFLNDLKRHLKSPDNLQWTKTTMFCEGAQQGEYKNAWLIVAGTAPRDVKYSDSAFTKKSGAVAACKLIQDDTASAGFKLDHCQLLAEDLSSNSKDVGLLGNGLQSLGLPASGNGVVVYCDPLWHTKRQTYSPGGNCYIRRLRNGKWFTEEFDFCNSAGRTQPCAGGFSIDLKLSDDNANDFQLLAGLPYVPSRGRVRAMNNFFSSSPQLRDIDSNETYFGSAVAFSPQSSVKSDAFVIVSSPSVMASSPSVYGYSLASYSDNIENPYFRISPPKMDLAAEFGGFGTTVETIQPPSTSFSATVLVGAPYEVVAGVGVNAGRVYLYCRASGNATVSKMVASLSGSRKGEMFGYAISRLADVDGDKIDDVAISAPAVGADVNTPGRVYIHRLLPDCDIEKNPFQVIEASLSRELKKQPIGFGISLSRSVDIDSDGGPELAVTTLDSSVPVLLYSMPQRMKAQCTFTAPREITAKEIQTGFTISVVFAIRLFNLYTGKQHVIPKGLASTILRTHQIDPDVLWAERFNQANASKNRSLVDDFFAFSLGSKIDSTQPRFELDGSLKVSLPSKQLMVAAKIRARVSGESMDLEAVPLHVAYRSILSNPACSGFNAENSGCKKTEQPVIDWSDCQWKMSLKKQLCVPEPTCHGDIGLLSWEDVLDKHTLLINGSISHVQIPFSEPKRKIRLVIVNNGPDKSTGIRIQLRSLGWPENDTDVGLRLKFVSIVVKDQRNGAILGSHGLLQTNRTTWSILVSQNDAAALIRSIPDTVIYPQDAIIVEADVYLDGLRTSQLKQELRKQNGNLPPLGVRATIMSVTDDPTPVNNEASLVYRINYEPRVLIAPGVTLPTIVDERKHSPKLESIKGQKVLGSNLGPQLNHEFLVENSGKVDLYNVTFQLDIPVETESGDTLLYLSDKARMLDNDDYRWVSTLPQVVSVDGKDAGSCHIDPKYINPLRLSIRDQLSGDILNSTDRSVRLRRSAEEAKTAPLVHFPVDIEDGLVQVYFKRSCQRQTVLTCPTSASDQSIDTDAKVVCAKITCRIGRLTQKNTVRIHITGWLWAASFFKLHLPDVRFVSRLSVARWGEIPAALKFYSKDAVNLNFPEPSPAYEMAQSIVFRGVTARHLDRMPLWPILTGVVAGGILLFALIALLYYCGFFQRRRRTQQEKNRLSYRKSIMGAPPAGAGHAASESPRPEFLLNDENKNNKFVKKNGRRARLGSYTGNPMVEGSPDLIYAHSPQPPSPPPEQDEEDTRSNDWLINTGEKEVEEKEALLNRTFSTTKEDKKELIAAVEDNEETPPEEQAGRTHRSSNDGIPDWFLSEVTENAKQ